MRRYCLSPVLVLCASFAFAQEGPRLDRVNRPEHVEISAGDVLIRTNGNRILVMVDTILDKTAAPDGLVDQWFTLETAEPPIPVFVHLAGSLIVHSPGALRISTAEERFEFVLADSHRSAESNDAITTRVAGIGLSHNTGPTTISLASQIDRRGKVSSECDECGPLDTDPGGGSGGGAACGSGGAGSTSCSVTSGSSSCSVTCAAGYYACCNGIAGSTNCRCVRN